MSGTEPKNGFEMQVGYDQQELLGARWWREGMQTFAQPVQRARSSGTDFDASRRAALKALVVCGGGVLVAGVVLGGTCSGPRTRTVTEVRNAIDVQRARGLAVGAESAAFAWPDAIATTCTGLPLDRTSLDGLAASMAPHDPELRPAYVPTLFQSVANGSNTAFAQTVQMVRSAAMAAAFAQGEAIRELFELAEQPSRWALVIDLPGPASVAFAAGLQPFADAVFVFDNWPHPRGVVPAHLTLAAALHYQSRFAPDDRRRNAPAAFVLDRDRLAPYHDEPDRFDNRYVAKLPDAAFLRARRVERVLHVVPAGIERELDDLNERFVAWREAGIEIRLLSLGDVRPEARAADQPAGATPPRYYWHGSPGYHWWFWNHYGWASRPAPIPPQRPPTPSLGSSWSPSRRSAPFDGAVGRLRETRTESTGGSGSRSGGSYSGGSWGRTGGGYSS